MNALRLIHFIFQTESMANLPTNILLNETINIFIDSLCDNNEYPPKIHKNDFCNLLNIANKQSLFTFNRKYCKQIDGVVM